MKQQLRAKMDLLPTWARSILKRAHLFIRNEYCRQKYVKLGRSAYLGSGFRLTVKNAHCVYLGERTNLEMGNIWSTTCGEIKVGDDCWFGVHNIVMGPVIIGNNVGMGPHVTIVGPHHAVRGFENNAGRMTVIGNNVWISANTTIMFGVKIGDNAIVGPASLVAHDVPPNAYVMGNPARDLTKLVKFG